jgi:hypothetical protein
VVTSRRTLLLGAVAVLAPLVVCAILATMRDTVPSVDAVLILVLIIVAVAAFGHRPSGILAALSSAIWFDFFLTQPYHQFTITDRDDIETVVLLTLVGVAVTEIALWGRRQQARSSRDRGYLDGLVSAAGLAAETAASADAVTSFIARQIRDVLGVERCNYYPGVPGVRPLLARDGSVSRNGHVIDVDRIGLPVDDEIDLVVERGGRVLGYFAMTSASRVARPSLEQRLVAVTLADQAKVVLSTSGQPTAPELN